MAETKEVQEMPGEELAKTKESKRSFNEETETKGLKAPRHDGPISLLCDDTDCEARYVGSRGEREVFVCRCVRENVIDSYIRNFEGWYDEIEEPPEYITTRGRWEVVADDEDSVENIRIVECGGLKCSARFGSGIHLHCESCFDHVIKCLR